MENLGIYSRVSKDKGGADRSLPTQKEDGVTFALSEGWEHALYTEKEGTSGTKEADERPQLWRLLNDVKERRITAIYAYDISRLERNENDRFLIFKTLNDANAKLYTKRDGFIDFTRPEIKLQLDILGATNSYMVALTKAKVKDTLVKNVRDKRNHGIPTFGYMSGLEKKLVIHPDNSEVVKRIFQMCIDGHGCNNIAKTLSDEGIPTPSNHSGGETLKYRTKILADKIEVVKSKLKWNPITINRILRNPIYKGERHWDGMVISIDGILSVELWDKAQAAIDKNKNNSINNTKWDYLLKDKVVCGECGSNYHGYTHQDRDVHVYHCGLRRVVNKQKVAKCGNKRVDQRVVEDIVWSRVIGNPLLLKVLQTEFDYDSFFQKEDYCKKIEVMVSKVASLSEAKKKLITMNAKDMIDDAELEEQLPEIKKEIANAESHLAELRAKQEIVNNRKEVLDEVTMFQAKMMSIENPPFELKRKLVEIFIDKVTVKYNTIDKLTEMSITLKLNLDFHSLTDDMSIDLKSMNKVQSGKDKKIAESGAKAFLGGKLKKVLPHNINGCRHSISV